MRDDMICHDIVVCDIHEGKVVRSSRVIKRCGRRRKEREVVYLV